MVGGSSEWISPAPYTTAVTAPRTRPRSRAWDSLCRCPIQISAADPIANTASTAQCEGPYAENSRFAEISATTSAVWSPIAPTISAGITPAATTPRLWSLRVYRNRRDTSLSKVCVGITVNADGPRLSVQPAIFRGRLTRGPGLAEGRVTAIAACRTCGTEPLENARFCHGCGSPVQDGDTHAEYKQVTVLFAEVVMRLSDTSCEREGRGTSRRARRFSGLLPPSHRTLLLAR